MGIPLNKALSLVIGPSAAYCADAEGHGGNYRVKKWAREREPKTNSGNTTAGPSFYVLTI